MSLFVGYCVLSWSCCVECLVCFSPSHMVFSGACSFWFFREGVTNVLFVDAVIVIVFWSGRILFLSA